MPVKRAQHVRSGHIQGEADALRSLCILSSQTTCTQHPHNWPTQAEDWMCCGCSIPRAVTIMLVVVIPAVPAAIAVPTCRSCIFGTKERCITLASHAPRGMHYLPASH